MGFLKYLKVLALKHERFNNETKGTLLKASLPYAYIVSLINNRMGRESIRIGTCEVGSKGWD